jgi:hypothetical protein
MSKRALHGGIIIILRVSTIYENGLTSAEIVPAMQIKQQRSHAPPRGMMGGDDAVLLVVVDLAVKAVPDAVSKSLHPFSAVDLSRS